MNGYQHEWNFIEKAFSFLVKQVQQYELYAVIQIIIAAFFMLVIEIGFIFDDLLYHAVLNGN